MKKQMVSSFSAEEWAYVATHFHLTTTTSRDRNRSITASDLLDEERCIAYLDWLSEILRSPSRMITASQFAKRYSFLVVASGLYAMTMCNKELDLSIENCCLDSAYHDESWLTCLRLGNVAVSEPNPAQRHEWRDEVIHNIFAGHVAKIWRVVSTVATIPMSILWENTAVRVYSLYEKRIKQEARGEEKVRLQGDFAYLLEAPAALFGETENPLARFYASKNADSSSAAPVRMRKTCCYYYAVSATGTCCTTCPKGP